MIVSEYRIIDNRLNVLVNSVDKILHLETINIDDIEFEKLKKSIIIIFKKLFDDNNSAEKYIAKVDKILHLFEQTGDNINNAKVALGKLIYDAIEEVNKVYNRNIKFISNCSIPYLTYKKALKLHKIFSQKLADKKRHIALKFSNVN